MEDNEMEDKPVVYFDLDLYPVPFPPLLPSLSVLLVICTETANWASISVAPHLVKFKQ